MKLDDPHNPPAFPTTKPLDHWGDPNGGMSLRDYFAAQAFSQAVEDYGQPDALKSTGQRRDRGNPVLPYATAGAGTREQIIARQAYRYADAMLAEREK